MEIAYGVKVNNKFGLEALDIDDPDALNATANQKKPLQNAQENAKVATAKAKLAVQKASKSATDEIVETFAKEARNKRVESATARQARPGKREFDRKSGSNKTGVKSVEKRDGAGSGNWGNYKDDGTEDTTEKKENVQPSAEEEEKRKVADEERKAEEEAEAKYMTLAEYKKANKGIKPVYNIRNAGEGEENKWEEGIVLNQNEDTVVAVEYEVEYVEVKVPRSRVLDIDIKYRDDRRSGFRRNGPFQGRDRPFGDRPFGERKSFGERRNRSDGGNFKTTPAKDVSDDSAIAADSTEGSPASEGTTEKQQVTETSLTGGEQSATTAEQTSFENNRPQRQNGERRFRRDDGDRQSGDRPKFGDRPRFGDRQNNGEQRPRFGDRQNNGEQRPRFGDRQNSGEQRVRFGDRQNNGEQRPRFGDRQNNGERPRFGDRQNNGERPRFGDRKNNEDRPPRRDGPAGERRGPPAGKDAKFDRQDRFAGKRPGNKQAGKSADGSKLSPNEYKKAFPTL